MNVSPKRMAQIEAGWRKLPRPIPPLMHYAYDVWVKDQSLDYTLDPAEFDVTTAQAFIDWLATDPTPAPLTVADLDEADRLGYALAKISVYRVEREAADDAYLNPEKKHYYSEIRKRWNEHAAAVATELRAIMRERGDVVVPGNRDEADDATHVRNRLTFPMGITGVALVIDAFLDHHAQSGAPKG